MKQLRTALFFVITAILLVVSSNNKPCLASEKVRIVLSSKTTIAAFVVVAADKTGLFKQEGIEVELVQIRPNIGLLALLNKDVDYLLLTDAIVSGAMRDLPIRIVSSVLDRSPNIFIAQPEIKSYSLLYKKTIAIDVPGSGTDNTIRMLLAKHNIDTNQLNFISAGEGKNRAAFLLQKVVDATLLEPIPVAKLLQKQNFTILANPSDIDYPGTMLGTTIEKISTRPAEVKKIVKVLLTAIQYIKTNKDKTLPILANMMGTDNKETEFSYDALTRALTADGTTPPTALKAIIEVIKTRFDLKKNMMTEEIAKKITDYSMLYEVQKASKR